MITVIIDWVYRLPICTDVCGANRQWIWFPSPATHRRHGTSSFKSRRRTHASIVAIDQRVYVHDASFFDCIAQRNISRWRIVNFFNCLRQWSGRAHACDIIHVLWHQKSPNWTMHDDGMPVNALPRTSPVSIYDEFGDEYRNNARLYLWKRRHVMSKADHCYSKNCDLPSHDMATVQVSFNAPSTNDTVRAWNKSVYMSYTVYKTIVLCCQSYPAVEMRTTDAY